MKETTVREVPEMDWVMCLLPFAVCFVGFLAAAMVTKKNVKSYDLTFNIWCTSRDSNPGPTD